MPKSLADLVRDKLNAGALPYDEPVKVWAGHGSGQPCAVCGKPVVPAEVEYEPQYDAGPPIRFHTECHHVWEAERHRDHYRSTA